MYDSEQDALDALIVRQMAHVNVVLSRIWYGIQPKVLEALDAAAKEWAEGQGWKGEFESAGEEWLSVNPPGWQTADDKRKGFYAYFQLGGFADAEETEGGDQDWLVTLVGAGVGRMGIYLMRGDEGNLGKPAWRKALTDPAVVSAMRALGFNYEDSGGSYFLRIPFEAEALAEGIEQGDMRRFLIPFSNALAKLPAAAAAVQPVIDRLKQPTD